MGQKTNNAGLSEEEKKRILAEEEKELQRMKVPTVKAKFIAWLFHLWLHI